MGGAGTTDSGTTMGASTDGATTGMGGIGGAGGTSAGGTGGTGQTTDGMSAGCGTEPGIAANMYNNGSQISIMAAGMNRRYILRVPDDYDNSRPYKLIIAWHQLDGNDVQMYANDYYHLEPLSGGSAIFAAPNGQKNGQPCTTTNNGDGGCGWPNSNGADVALGDAVVEELKSNFCIDTNRIFATGWSYGGSMSYKHACERGLGGTKDGVEGYVRGIAVYSGAQLSGQCTPSTPVAYYGSHGLSDNVLGYSGGVGLAQNFANANGCDWSTPPEGTGQHVCTDIAGCDADYPVQFCSFNGGHTPDPSDGGQSWQYQLVWDFFDQF
jgi:poly(3-hydroxybutyrate) depolymerase